MESSNCFCRKRFQGLKFCNKSKVFGRKFFLLTKVGRHLHSLKTNSEFTTKKMVAKGDDPASFWE